MTQSKDEEIRMNILAGADELFRKYGFNKTTMADIAKISGRGKSTLYHYYKSKEEIFDALVEDERMKLIADLESAIASAVTAKEKLHAFFTTRFERLRDCVNLNNVLVQESIEALRAGVSHFTTRHRMTHELNESDTIKEILEFGIRTGEFRQFTESEIDMMAFIFMSAQHGLELDLVVYDRLDEMLAKLNFFQEILIKGIEK
jgi:AcrR family transcriptional regulator